MRDSLDQLTAMHLPLGAVAGGPCSGKSTYISQAQGEADSYGTTLIAIPEAATVTMEQAGLTNGKIGQLRTHHPEAFYQFQIGLAWKQVRDELNAAHLMNNVLSQNKVIGLVDRTIIDIQSYLSEDQHKRFVGELGLHPSITSWRYPFVQFLVSTAVGAAEYYTKANNLARIESVEEAALLDRETLQAYVGHPHLEIFRNEGSWVDKLAKLNHSLRVQMGFETPLEIERKWQLSEPPTPELLERLRAVPVRVRQYYTLSEDGRRIRYREWGDESGAVYLRTEKVPVTPGIVNEFETRISQREFLQNLSHREPKTRIIEKIRWCFVYRYQYFHLDQFVIPQATGWLLELELDSLDADYKLPPEFKLTEVTGDARFSNSTIAAA
jgi:CYTH domain-containing protein